MHTLSDAIFRPLANYNFLLQVEGMYDVPCKSVKGINQEQEYEYIQEGGLNDRVHMRKKQQSKPYTFQVERYVECPTRTYLYLTGYLICRFFLLCQDIRSSFKAKPYI